MGKAVRGANIFEDEFGTTATADTKPRPTEKKATGKAATENSGNIFLDNFGVEKKNPSETTSETSQDGTKPTVPSPSVSISETVETPKDKKERYANVETSNAQTLLDDYKQKSQEKNLDFINDPFSGGRKYKDYSQSREGKVGLIVSNILDKGQFDPQDINYLAKVAPTATKQLVQSVVNDADQTNILSEDNLAKLVIEGREKVSEAVTRQKIENNQKINANVKKSLSGININPSQLQDDKYATSIVSSIDERKKADLKDLESKYPSTTYAAYNTSYNYRKNSDAYDKEKAGIVAKYSQIQNEIGLSKAYDFAAKNPTLTPKEIGEQYLKYADPDTYALWVKAGKKGAIDRDLAEIGVKALYGTGLQGAVELAKTDETHLDDQYPDKKKAEVLHRLGAELYKDENWIFNAAPDVKRLDKAAQQLTQSDRDFYYKHIREEERRNIGTDVPMSGFLNKTGEGIASTAAETANFVGDILGTRSEKDQAIDALDEGNKTKYQDVGTYGPAMQELKELNNKQKKGEVLTADEIEKKQDLESFTGVRSKAQEVIDGTGNLTGQVIFQAAATKGLGGALNAGVKGAGLLKAEQIVQGFATEDAIASHAVNFGVNKALATEVAATAIAYASSYDQAKRDALRLMPEDKDAGKRNIYATIVGGLNAGTERIFKDEKVLDAFNKEIAPNIKNLVSQLGTDAVSRGTLAPQITKILLGSKEFLKEALISNTKEATEELATSVGQSVTTAILAPAKFNDKQAFDDAVSTFTTMFQNGGLVAGMAGLNSFRANHIGIPTMAKLGVDEKLTEDTKSYINAQLLSGEMTQEEANEKFKILNTASKINTVVMPQVQEVTKLPQKAANKYSVQLLNENLLRDKSKQAKIDGDTVLESKYEAQIKDSEKVRKDILDKKLFVDENYAVKTEDQINKEAQTANEAPIADETIETHTDDSLFEKVYSKKGQINNLLDPEKKEESVSMLKDQALTTPNNLNDKLGKDEGLTTDLIAANSPQDIQKSIDQFQDQLKQDGNTEQQISEIDKHLSLLDKGLDKANILNSKNQENVNKKSSQESGGESSQKISSEKSDEIDDEKRNVEKNQTGAVETTETNAAPLTKEAQDLLASIGEGSKPTFITQNLEKIAKENGVSVTKKMTADDVINALKEKSNTITKPKVRVSAEQLEAAQPSGTKKEEDFNTFKNTVSDDILNVKESSFDWRIKLPDDIPTSQREKGIADIKEGKETVASKKVLSAIQDMYNNGEVLMNRGRGNQAETIAVPLKEYLSGTKNIEPATDEDIESINTSLGEEAFNNTFDEIYNNVTTQNNEQQSESKTGQTEQSTPKSTAINKETTSAAQQEKSTTKTGKPEKTNVAKPSRKALADNLRKILGNEASALNREGDTNPQNRVSFEDLGITSSDTVDQALDKLIAYGGEFTDIFKAIKEDENIDKIRLELSNSKTGGENNEAGLYHPIGHGEGKDGLLQIHNKDNVYYTAAHELMHFLTLDSKAAEEIKDRASYKGLEDMYNYIVSKKGKPVAIAGQNTVESYGLTNVKEFMAELLINPKFRQYVSDVFASNKEDILNSSKNLRDSKVIGIGDLIYNFFKDIFDKLFTNTKGVEFDTNKSVVDNAAKLATDLFFKGQNITKGQTESGEGGKVIGMGSENQKAAALAYPSNYNTKDVSDFVNQSYESGADSEDIKGALEDNGFSKEEINQILKDNPPPTNITEDSKEKGTFENNKKSILSRITESKNIPKYVKERFEKEGLNYDPQSHVVSREMAKNVINEFGVEDSIVMAESGRFNGDVNSMIFAEGIDQTYLKEQAATTPQGKQRLAEQWADYATRYDEMARQKGKFISAVYEFYRRSPLGITLAEKSRRNEIFNDWFKNKNSDYQEVWQAIKDEPAVKEFIGQEVESKLKEERKTERQSKKDKVHKSIDQTVDKWTKILTPKTFSKDNKTAGPSTQDIMKAVGAIMKVAYDAGESIANIAQKAIDYISEQLGHENWDQEAFKKEVESQFSSNKSKLDIYKERLQSQIDNLNQQINDKKRENRQKNSLELDDEAKELLNKRDELKKQLEEVAPIKQNEEWLSKNKERILDRFRKKITGLTDSQKEDVVRRSFKQIVDNGGLEYDDFKKIVANVIGLGDLNEEEINKINQYVTDLNSVQDAADKALLEKSKKSIDDFYRASKKAERAATELGNITGNKADLKRRIIGTIQLNTLGVVSLIKNPFYNIAYQILVRLPKGIVQTALDQTIYGVTTLANKTFGTPVVKPDVNILLAQRGYFSQGAKGGSESIKQVFTGLTNMDYFQKELRDSQIKPLTSWKDLWKWKKGEKFLSNTQVADKFIQGTVGIPAEAVARLLNIGDKGFRSAAVAAVATTIAQQQFGIKDNIEKELFATFPKEEATRLFIAKGFSKEEAAKKSEAIEKRITYEGEAAVFQQENLLNKAITGMSQGIQSFSEKHPDLKGVTNVMSILGTLNMPFLKTPANLAWDMLNLASPELAITQSALYGFAAAFHKFKGNDQLASEYFLKSKKWLSHATVGYAVLNVAAYYASIGAISGGDDDEKGKERKGKKTYQRPRSLNVSKVLRSFSGDDTNDDNGDLLVDLSWFGTPGTILNMQANRFENLTEEEKKNKEALGEVLPRMNSAISEGLENSIFNNSIAALNAFRQGGRWTDTYMVSTLNVASNFFQAATFAQWSRAQLPYNPTLKADTFGEELKNNFASRSGIFRWFAGNPPADITIWGDKSMRNNSGWKGTAFNMLGFDEVNKDIFAEPIFQDFKRTGNTSFFPTDVLGKMTVDGQDKKMSTEQERQFKTLVGQARKSLVDPYINQSAVMESKDENIDGKKYNELPDDLRVKVLNILYKKGYEAGKSQFKILYPEFMSTKEKQKQEEAAENE